jgi:hypothetical protein
MLLLRLLLREDTPRNRRIFCTLTGVCLILVSALRAPTVGRDTASFIEVFLKIEGRDFLDVLKFSSWTEPGFRLLCAFLGLFTKNGQWLIVITSLLIHGAVVYFLYKHCKNPYLGCFLYVTTMLYPLFFSMMRQALAVAVWMLSYGFLKRKKWVPYLLMVLLAASFHTSALLFLAFPLFTLFRVERKHLKVLLPATLVVSVLCMLFVRPLVALAQKIFPRYADYEPTTFDALYVFFAVFVLIVLYGVLRLYLTEKGRELLPVSENGFDERSFLLQVMLAGAVLAGMMTGFGQLQRLFNYFEVFYLLWLPACVPPAFAEEKSGRLAFPLHTLAALLIALAYFVVLLFFRSGIWYDAMPYTFFF